jgi:uncharacterized protein with von Willebrand factor type A (vWA) domain
MHATQNQQCLNSILAQMQTRFEEMEKKINHLTTQSPCITQVQGIEETYSSKVRLLEQEQRETNSKLKVLEQQRYELLESNRSLASGSYQHIYQQAAKQAEVDRLKQEIKGLQEQVSQLTVLAAPAVKKLATRQAESERRQKADLLMQGSVGLGNLPVSDKYQIKKTKPR